MDIEERQDLADKRLNAHAVRQAAMDERLLAIKEDTGELKAMMIKQTDDFLEAVQPVKLLTDANSRAIITMSNDIDWIRPWVRRGMWVGGSAGVVGVVSLILKFM